MNISGKHHASFVGLLLVVVAAIATPAQNPAAPQPEAAQLLALANQARAQAGAPPLHWDSALAEAARKHTLRMAAEGPIAHRYPGELDVSERAAHAGAHFDLLEENIAIGATPEAIHDGWMHSPEHHDNLLNPKVDRVGIAIVATRGVLYATADYAHGVGAVSGSQAETQVADLIRPSGLKIRDDHSIARAACEMTSGFPSTPAGTQPAAEPGLVVRWQQSDLSHLPKDLVDNLASGHYHEAAVGSCEPKGDVGTFTVYRIAVLLY